MLAYPGAQMLDVTGPVEVFARSARFLVEQGLRRDPVYQVEVIAERSGPVKTSSGIEVLAARPLAAVRGSLDTLLVAGGLAGTHTPATSRVSRGPRTAARGRVARISTPLEVFTGPLRSATTSTS